MNAQRGVVLVLIVLLSYLTFQLVDPYLQFIIGAFLLAYVLLPLQRRLEPRYGSTVTAGLLVIGAILALLVPFFILIVAIAADAIQFASGLAADDVTAQIGPLETWINTQFGQEVDLTAEIATRLEGFAEMVLGTAPDIIGLLTNLTVGLGLAAFLLFYLLRDSDRLADWSLGVTPLPDAVQKKLYGRISDITRAVLLGHVLVAIIQGGIAGLGLLLVGISNVLLWTGVMILLALLPFIGTFLVWGPAAIYLLAIGDTVGGSFLIVYGTIVVGISDEYLRPVIVDQYAEISPAVIVIGVIGGLSAFGVMGLFVGPIIIGALKASVEIFDEQYDQL